MRIEFEAAPAVDEPTPEEVDRGLRALVFPDNSFAILGSRPASYIQTAVDDDGSFIVEYQDGSPDDHFRAAPPTALDDVIEAFQSYLRQDDAWKRRFEWRKVDVGPPGASPGRPAARRSTNRGPRRTRTAGARPADQRRLSAGCLVAFYAVLIPPTVVLMIVLLKSGVEGGLAGTGLAGEPGQLMVTACHPTRYDGGCSGLFMPSDRALALPSVVPVEGWYRAGDAVAVHLLDGDAWPEGGPAAAIWVVALLFGGLLLAALVLGLADVARRTWTRVRGGRAGATLDGMIANSGDGRLMDSH
jgi:hypothetical protein